MAEYALKHPLVWLVHFPFSSSALSSTSGAPSSSRRKDDGCKEDQEGVVVEEGVILNVKYSLKAGNALVIYCPSRDIIVELPLKTIIRKIRKVDVTPYYPKINKSFEKNKDHISVNTKRLLRVSLSITDEKIAAAQGNVNSSDSEEEDDEDEDEDDEESTSDESSDEEEDVKLGFKVDIQLPNGGNEVRGKRLVG